MANFTLQPYQTSQSRYRCPECNHHSKSFVRYINTTTGNQLADHVGRCGRLDKCGYHYKPRHYFADNPDQQLRNAGSSYTYRSPVRRSISAPEPHYISADYVNGSFGNYAGNHFVQYLIARLGFEAADRMVGLYRIGSSAHWPGATIFWQLDAEGLVRTGKIMLYNAQTGKRVKHPFNHITWAHTLLLRDAANVKLTGGSFQLRQCLFGEHLLAADPHKPVAIVESEKTAIIAASHVPDHIWLAAGSITNLRAESCQVLQHRRVTLYPDLGAYTQWQVKARTLQAVVKGSVFNVSDLLEKVASDEDRKKGLDLGDFL